MTFEQFCEGAYFIGDFNIYARSIYEMTHLDIIDKADTLELTVNKADKNEVQREIVGYLYNSIYYFKNA